MTAQIKPNRLEVNDRFPMLGFNIRADQPDVEAEVTLATDIELFKPENRAQRSAANFYSSRESGRLSVPRGEGVFVVPPDVLARFIGRDRLFFGLASGKPNNGGLQVDALPRDGSPYVSLRGLTGRTLRRTSLGARRKSGPPAFEWAGDAAKPGTEPATATNGHSNGSVVQIVEPNGSGASNGSAVAANTAATLAYDDGFGRMPAPALRRPTPVQAMAYSRGLDASSWSADKILAWLKSTASTIAVSLAADVSPPHVLEIEGDLLKTAARTAYRTYAMTLGPLGPVLAAAPELAAQTGLTIAVGPVGNSPFGGAAFGIAFAPDGGIAVFGSVNFDLDISGLADIMRRLELGIGARFAYFDGGFNAIRSVAKVASAAFGEEVVVGAEAFFNSSNAYLGAAVRVEAGVAFEFSAPPRAVAFSSFDAEAALQWIRQKVEQGVAAVASDVNPPYVYRIPADWRGAFMTAWNAYSLINLQPWLAAIPKLAASSGVTLSIGPAFDTPVAGAGVGVVFAPDGDIGLFGVGEISLSLDGIQAFLSSLKLAIQAKMKLGYNHSGISGFESIRKAAGVAVGEEIVVGAEVWLDGNGNGLGGAVSVGIGFAFQLAAEDARDQIVRPQLPGDHRARASRIGGQFAGRIGEALDLGLSSASLDPLLDTLDPPLTAKPMSYQPRARAMSTTWSINWDDVQLIPQPTGKSCWATTLAMLIGWRDQVSIAPDTIAQQCGRSIGEGLPWAEREAAATALGLGTVPPQCYLPEGFAALIENHGPLYVGKMMSGTIQSGHAVLVVGMYSDGTDYFVRVVDPWDRPVGSPGSPGDYEATHNSGSRYIMKYDEFQLEYEMAAAGNPAYVQILYAGIPAGRTINRSTTPPIGYAMAYTPRRPARAMVRPMNTYTYSVNWDDVDVAPQPTSGSCWATSAALLLGWRDQMSIMPQWVADQCGIPIVSTINHDQVQHVANTLGLSALQPQCYTPDGFSSLIETLGPLWVGKLGTINDTWGHVVLAVGMYSDGTDHYVRIVDPLDRSPGTPGSPGNYPMTHVSGSRYIMRYSDFALEYEMAAGSKPEHVLILHVGGIGLRQPNRALAAPPGYAMAAGQPKHRAALSPLRSRPRAMDAGAVATIAGTAVTLIVGSSGGDIDWRLPQWTGYKHPNDTKPANEAPYRTSVINLDDGPTAGDCYAHPQIRWSYNGTSIGPVYVERGRYNDTWGWGATTSGIIQDIPMPKPRSPAAVLPGADQVAALDVLLTYDFQAPIGTDDPSAQSRITLYGDGTYEIDSQWVEHSDTPLAEAGMDETEVPDRPRQAVRAF